MKTLGLTLCVLCLSGCATFGRVAYSSPTVDEAGGVRHVPPRESAVAMDIKGGGSIQVDLFTFRFAGLAGLLLPIIPYAGRDMGSEDLLHVTLWLSQHPEPLVVDPSAITLSVDGGSTMKPVCAIKSVSSRGNGARDYVYLARSDVSGRCERGLFGGETSSFAMGPPTDSVASNDYRTYELFYPIRFDEPRPLLLRIDGISSGSGVVALPALRYERESRWRFYFGAPF